MILTKRQCLVTLVTAVSVFVILTYFDKHGVSRQLTNTQLVKYLHEHPHLIVDNLQHDGVSGGEDDLSHRDNEAEALRLKKQVRVLIWIMTSPKNREKATVVRDTWAKRANKFIFFSSHTDLNFPTVGLNVSEGREHLTAKTMQGFRYVYQHHLNDADWFMKADDDTYVIVENLRYFLSDKNTSEPVYYGHHFKVILPQGYYSGGAGYVLSKEALIRLNTKGRDPQICQQDHGAEDVTIGKCMQNLGVKTANSSDALGRSRFHSLPPDAHIHGLYPGWYYDNDANGAKPGVNEVSDYAISFHYIDMKYMKTLDFYIYHLRPYGIQFGKKKLNAKQPNRLLNRKNMSSII